MKLAVALGLVSTCLAFALPTEAQQTILAPPPPAQAQQQQPLPPAGTVQPAPNLAPQPETLGRAATAPQAAPQAAPQCVKRIRGVEDGQELQLNDPCNIEIEGDIDSHSHANIASAGFIHLHGKIDGRSEATLNAGRDIIIDDKIDGASEVHLHAGTPGVPAPISIAGKIDEGDTHVTWCGSTFNVGKGVQGDAQAVKECP
jgi:hypothetical protein